MSESGKLTAWMGFPPTLRDTRDVIRDLLDDVLALMAPYGVESVWSDEPRTYRLTPRGRAPLGEALADRRVGALVIDTPSSLLSPSDPRGRDLTRATAHLKLGSCRVLSYAGFATVIVVPRGNTSFHAVAAHLVDFVLRWFATLHAAQAFVSDDPGDDGMVTRYEFERPSGVLLSRQALSRYLRGTFWGTGLGSELCGRLGGVDHVLRDAPAAIKTRVGDGAWLQLSALPPAPAGARERLAHYLSPLLGWSREDIQALDRTRPAPLPAPPAPEQERLVEAAMHAWYLDEGEGAFGGEGFHWVSDPSVDRRRAAMRWSADLGHADPDEALPALASRLGAVSGVTVVRLVVGHETVG